MRTQVMSKDEIRYYELIHTAQDEYCAATNFDINEWLDPVEGKEFKKLNRKFNNKN